MNDAELEREFPLDQIRKKDAGIGYLEQWQQEHPGALEDYAFFPLGTRYSYIFIGFERSSARLVGLLKTPGIQQAPEPP